MVLVAFDFDGTLSQTDLMQLLGREYDVAGEVRGLTEQGLRGEVPFDKSLRQRAGLFDGMPESRVERAYERGRMRSGAADLVADLRRADATVAIITSSFERGVESILDRENVAVDHLIANRLVMENGAVTGAVDGPITNGNKDAALQELATREEIPLEQTIAVGNGAVDLPMLQVAGTAIGFEPERLVESHCDVVVTSIRKLQLYFDQHGLLD
ncbi:MAG: HAD family hydrolase [archaeon]